MMKRNRRLVPPNRRLFQRLKSAAERMMDKGEWRQAERQLRRAISIRPNDHWLLARISLTLRQQRRNTAALDWSTRAMAESPRCPYVLSEHAANLSAVEKDDSAKCIYETLLKSDFYVLAYGECGEGIRFAQELLNDSRWELARIYNNSRRYAASKAMLREFISRRRSGEPAEHTIKDAKLKLELVSASNSRSKLRKQKR